MNRNILYYPTIEFRQEDYHWLWISALLWDRIYRIVPKGYQLNEPDNIRELCSTDEIGVPLYPNRYSKEVAEEFLDKIETRTWQAAALDFSSDDVEEYEEYTRLHKDKVDVVLKNIMLINKDVMEDDEWMYIPQEMASIYMTFLANHIANENNLSLNTHNSDIWTASTYFQHNQSIQDNIYIGEDYVEPSTKVLASILFKDIIPSNIMGIEPKKILEFREKRRDERKEFLQEIQMFQDSLGKVRDPKIIEQIVNDESKKIEKVISQYKKSMDMIKVVKWTGSISTLVTIGVDALGYVNPTMNILKPLTTAGIGLGFVTGLIERKQKTISFPYSYLTDIRNIDMHNFNSYYYNLYRKMEEFIND